MPGESTHRSVPADKRPEQGAEETGLPGPGRTYGIMDGEDRYDRPGWLIIAQVGGAE